MTDRIVIEHAGGRTSLDSGIWERVSEGEYRNRTDGSRLTLLPPEEMSSGYTPWVYTDPCGFRWLVGKS